MLLTNGAKNEAEPNKSIHATSRPAPRMMMMLGMPREVVHGRCVRMCKAFIFTQARLLERLLFAVQFENADPRKVGLLSRPVKIQMADWGMPLSLTCGHPIASVVH